MKGVGWRLRSRWVLKSSKEGSCHGDSVWNQARRFVVLDGYVNHGLPAMRWAAGWLFAAGRLVLDAVLDC